MWILPKQQGASQLFWEVLDENGATLARLFPSLLSSQLAISPLQNTFRITFSLYVSYSDSILHNNLSCTFDTL
jgi:hypothetical protein